MVACNNPGDLILPYYSHIIVLISVIKFYKEIEKLLIPESKI
jgi:hypothetical protein